MTRPSRATAAAIVATGLILRTAAPAAAQTTTTKPLTTTSTSTTTTTTLLPHPFSPETASCVHEANASLRACRRGGGGSACFTPWETEFGNCFGPGAGVKCANKCATNDATCIMKLPATKRSCRTTCKTNVKADRKACRLIASGDNIWAGGDGSCLSSAQSTFDLCRSVCADLAMDCKNNLKFCVANCANL